MVVELEEVYAFVSLIYISNKLNNKTNNKIFTLNFDEPSPPPLLSGFELSVSVVFRMPTPHLPLLRDNDPFSKLVETF